MRSAILPSFSSSSPSLRRDSIASMSTGSSCTRRRSASRRENNLGSSSAIRRHPMIPRSGKRCERRLPKPAAQNRRPQDPGLAANKDHGAGRGQKARLVDAVPFFFLRDDGDNLVADFAVTGSAAQKRPQVVILLAEQACPQLSVGRQSQTRAKPAERLRHRGNQSDLAGAVGKP